MRFEKVWCNHALGDVCNVGIINIFLFKVYVEYDVLILRVGCPFAENLYG